MPVTARPTRDAGPVILVDSNVPMYLIGASHRHKADAQRVLERLVGQRARLVTDAAVLQEILHRYAIIDRRDAIQPAFDVLFTITDEVLPIDRAIVEQAKVMLLDRRGLSARAAVHVAVMQVHGIPQVLSFDASFDRLTGIARLAE